MKILDGKKLNNEIAEELKKVISEINREIRLVILQVGQNPDSNIFIKHKKKFAEKIGAKCDVVNFSANITQGELVNKIQELNNDQSVHGIIVQMPLPEYMNVREVLNSIKSEKDVDGLSDKNLVKLLSNDKTGIVPATAKGIVTLLEKNEVNLEGKKVVVVGRSILVGKSTSLLLLNKNATVTVCHSHTIDLNKSLKEADIIIVAVGQPGLIKYDNLSDNQVVVDVGISTMDGKILGDVFLTEEEKEKIQAFSPVPGGVGPMTVASIFQNLLQAFYLQQ